MALLEHLDKWEAEWLEAGRQAGLKEGLLKGFRKGKQEGWAEGWLAGQLEARRECNLERFIGLVRARFGELPPHALGRIRNSEPAQLVRWGDRMFKVQSLTELFDE
jgi:hypothetical protein